MKKGQTLNGVVERVDFPNKGVVHTEEGTCIVKNSLPGQEISLGVQKVRKGKAEGRLIEVITPSPLETNETCPHFGACGGCTYLSLPYEEELKIKENQVKRLLDSVMDKQEELWVFEGIKASPDIYEYRNKMEFSFGDEVKDGPLALGMHKRGSFYDVVTVSGCKIVDEDYRSILTGTLNFFKERQVTFFHRLRHEGCLRHLLVRKAVKTGEILIALVTTTQNPEITEEAGEVMKAWKDMLLSLPLKGKIAGILQIDNDSVADVVKSDATHVLYGQEYFYEELLGLKFKISTFSFFQTNSLGAQVLYQTARDYIGDSASPDKIVYDLYSGTGTIAQLMAPVSKKVIGVEIVEEAVEAAKQNAAENGLTNCEFIAGDVLKVIVGIEEKPDLIILDPPRDGIHPKALTKIIDYGVDRIVYISCKPTSLVRDLDVFLDRGYRLERAVAVDQFPWTTGIETIALLTKKEEIMNKILVFSDSAFPGYKESNIATLEGATVCSAKGLGQALMEDYDVFVNLHGSHFPLNAVAPYYKFLQKGKGYVQCFGAPLEYIYSVNEAGEYVCENKQMSYFRKLNIHSVLPVSQSGVVEYTDNVENQVAAGLCNYIGKEDTLNFILTPTKDAYVEEEWGSIGSMDSYIRPLVMGMDVKNQHISSPVVLMENRAGEYAGSRWIFANTSLKEEAYGKLAELIAPLAQFAACGHREITVKPSYAMYEVGEKPVIALAAQNFGKASDWQVSMKIYGNEGTEEKELWTDTISVKGQNFPSQINVVPEIEVNPGIYKVVTEWNSEDGEKQCIIQGFCVRDQAVLKSLESVRCTKDYFVIDGKMQAVVGTTYMSGEVSRSYLQLPNVSNWLNDMQEMKAVGLNWVRTGIWCNHRRFMLDDGHFDEFILRSIDAFVQVAATVGLHVTFTFFPFVPEAFEGSHPYLDRRSIEAQKRFIAKVVERHKDSTNIDWDLINEPFTSDHPSQKKKDTDILEDLDFRAYMEKKYGSIDKLLWSLDRTVTEVPSFDALPLPTADKVNFEVNDMAAAKNGIIWVDYQNYRMDMFKRWMIELRDMINAIAPGQLVTVGQDEALNAQRPSPLIYGKELDYNNMHSWWLMDDLVWDTRFAKADGKPLLVQETGIMYTEAPNGVPRRSEEDLAKILRRKFAYAYGTKCAGAIHWIWNTNYYMNNANESNIGAIRCDRSRKPEFMAYEQFARFFEKTHGIITDIVDDEQVAVIFPYSNDFSNKSFALHATKHLTKILTYQMKVPFVGVGEYDLDQLRRQDFKVIFVPSAHHFETKQFEELIKIAEDKGSTIVFTGPISYDEHFIKTDRARGLVGETKLYGLDRFEDVTYNGKSYLFSFDNTYVSKAFREECVDKSTNGCVKVQIGKGQLIWFASPLEICAETEKLAELYSVILKECNVELPFKVKAEEGKEVLLSAVFVSKTTWEKGALYTLVNESSKDLFVVLTDVATGREYRICVPAEDAALFAIDENGNEVGRF